MMTQLCETGALLYGPRWHAEIGRALGVTDRTVRRWLAGDPIPDRVGPVLRDLVSRRIDELKQAQRHLPR